MPSWAKWGLSLLVAIGLISIGWRVIPVLVTLHIVVCFVLIIVIMLQSGSAADLAGAFGGAGSQTAFGPRGAATFLSRATTWCAIVFMMTSLALSVKRSPNEESRHRFGAGANAEVGDSSGSGKAGASADSDSNSAYAAAGVANDPAQATAAKPGSQEVRASAILRQVLAASLNEMRSWRNWQTHQLEGLAVAIPWWFESTRPHQPSFDSFFG